MNPLPQDDRAEAAVWQAMVLFSTLSTATEVWRAARERRAGHDPSEQEEAVFVRSYLREAAGVLQARLMRMQAGLIQAEREEPGYLAALVRRYHDLMALHRVVKHLHVVHQRLLSLYPGIPEVLVEEARLLEGEGHVLLEAESNVFLAQLGPFLHRALVFTGDLHRFV
ncbi:MAG: hypothetical protein ACE5G0_00970 [Rhodothermales bacterium]